MPDRFCYITYIRTTPEMLWDALLKPEFTRQYWFGVTMQSEWKKGGGWKMVLPDGRIADAGEILEIEKPRRIVIKWRNEWREELKAEGWSRCTIELEPVADAVKLSILHEIDKGGSRFIEAVSGGWPKILSSLKSLMETGAALPELASLPKG